MKRVAGGLVMCALLAGAIACTSDDPPDAPPTKKVAVEPEEVARHETASGAPISFGIEIPDGAVQVGPLVRQRRTEVGEVIEGPSSRADAFQNDESDGETSPQTRDPEEPTPPDFTTAMLRIDGEPSEVVQRMLSELSDSLSGSGIDAEHWRKYCTVSGGVYTGCRMHARGTTEEDEHVAVEFTVDPGDPASKSAPAGSLLRPVMVLTLERLEAREGDGDQRPTDPADAQAREAQAGIDSREAEENAIAAAKQDARDKPGRNTNADDRTEGANSGQKAEQTSDETGDSDESDGPDGDGDGADDSDKQESEPRWPTMKREWPAKPGDWILTPKWKVRPNIEVILSSSMPQVAMLAVKDGADPDRIARRYVRMFADEATTPKIDEVEDRNERNITYTPRNDGSGPSVAVTTVATGRGNYIELLFSDGDPSDALDERTGGKSLDGGRKSDGGKGSDGKGSGDRSTAKRTTSKTG